MPQPQRTVARGGEVAGVGLHSGLEVTARFEPAPSGHGVVFVREDLAGSPQVPARHIHQREVERRTALAVDLPDGVTADVHTPEHLLAALMGLGIDNLIVRLDGPELPGGDGSAKPWVDAIQAAGIETQDAERVVQVLEQPVAVDRGTGVSLVAFPHDGGLRVSYTLQYDHPFLGTQHVSFDVDPETFEQELAPARTFCMAKEASMLQAAGLGKGATTQNTLVVEDDGVRDNTLRFPDEFARHKALDLLGDLFLLGRGLQAHVIALRSGHAANLDLVRALDQDAQARSRGASERDPDPSQPTESGLNAVQIRRVLPHRYPFLLVDRVLEIEGYQRAVGVKCVSVNEPFFTGHYPGEPIMPGVLIIEAMAQLAGILLLRKLELTGKVPVLLSIDRVKFRRAVVPGDQLIMEANTLRLSSGRGRVRCRSTVGGKLVSEARLNFALTEPRSS